jgi:capsular polysaccharide biosynthesis protein
MHVLITTLAQYQTGFWAAVGRALAARGHRVGFIAFDDRSHEMLAAAGLESVNAKAAAATGESLGEACARLGIHNPNLLFSHERAAFAIRDRAALERKFLQYLAAVESCFGRHGAAAGQAIMVQELGGFLSVLAAYHAARVRGIDNLFIEPSFFKGRLFFTPNTLAAPKVRGRATPSPEVLETLRTTIERQAIVVPNKDRLHYRPPALKVINLANARRLVRKLVDIHVLGKRYEFGYVGHHVRTHVRQMANSLRLSGLYTPLSEVGRFVYYPLHVPADVALTLRSPEYLDQLGLVDFLARTVPWSHRVVLKEHPAMVGSMDVSRLRTLLRAHDNIRLLPHTVNNFDVLRRADAVVSVNSKSGAEALLLGKPVVVLGDAFYRESGLVRVVERLHDLPQAVADAFARSSPPGDGEVHGFFQAVWDQTLPGELYDERAGNVAAFAESLGIAIAKRAQARGPGLDPGTTGRVTRMGPAVSGLPGAP